MLKWLLNHLYAIAAVGFTIYFSSFFQGQKLEFWYTCMIIYWLYYIGMKTYIHFAYKDKNADDQIIEYHEPPSSQSPASVSYLVFEKVDLYIVYGTLLHLVNRNILSLEKEGDDYLFKVIKYKFEAEEIEKYILYWLFVEKNTDTISMKDFKREFRAEKGKESLIERLVKIEEIMKAETNKYFVNMTKPKRILKWINRIMFVLSLIVGIPVFGMITLLLSTPPCILVLLEVTIMMKKNEEGKEEYLKWLGFSYVLERQMDMARCETEEVILWDEYMTYAIALGKAKKAIEELDWLSNNIVEVSNGASRYTNL